MRNQWRLLGALGTLCLVGVLGCTTTTPTPPPPGYYVPYCPPAGYQTQTPQACAPANANVCNPCVQGWRPAQ